MATQNKTLAFKAMASFAHAHTTFVEQMIAAGYKTLEDAKHVVFEYVSMKTGVPFRIAESSGNLRWDTTHESYEAAKKAANRYLAALAGGERKSSAKKERDPVEDAIKAFNKLTTAEQRKFLKAIGQ